MKQWSAAVNILSESLVNSLHVIWFSCLFKISILNNNNNNNKSHDSQLV